MDDPPKAHPCVQAGKMPALPGVATPPACVDLPAKGRAQFHKLRHILLDDCDGVAKVIAWLRFLEHAPRDGSMSE